MDVPHTDVVGQFQPTDEGQVNVENDEIEAFGIDQAFGFPPVGRHGNDERLRLQTFLNEQGYFEFIFNNQQVGERVLIVRFVSR